VMSYKEELLVSPERIEQLGADTDVLLDAIETIGYIVGEVLDSSRLAWDQRSSALERTFNVLTRTYQSATGQPLEWWRYGEPKKITFECECGQEWSGPTGGRRQRELSLRTHDWGHCRSCGATAFAR